MLVLSRKVDEKVIIHDDIVITIVDIRSDKVRIGISAPQEVPVHREEVKRAIDRKNAKSVEPSHWYSVLFAVEANIESSEKVAGSMLVDYLLRHFGDSNTLVFIWMPDYQHFYFLPEAYTHNGEARFDPVINEDKKASADAAAFFNSELKLKQIGGGK